mmetsp:Transcript_29239/g.52251  ORF Transcript_29239/g.52251 Transcript_29239/m.52251 type:complete len:386 (-) Transcript_29239:33-1190(-)
MPTEGPEALLLSNDYVSEMEEGGEFSLEDQVLINLNLLDFANFEIERDLKVKLERDLFRKANSRALDTILYFLFTQIATDEQRLAFMFSWPPRTPSMRREFRDEAFKLLQLLENEDKLPKQTILGKSVLETAQGERALTLLKKLSEAALCFLLKSRFGVQVPRFKYLEECVEDPNLASRGLLVRTKRAIMLSIQNQVEAFKRKAGEAVASQRTWLSSAETLISEHKALRTSLDLMKRPKQDKSAELMEQMAALDRVPQIDVLKYLWKKVEDLSQASEHRRGRALVSCLLDNSKPVLEYDIEGKKRPDIQMKKWAEELSNIKDLMATAGRTSDKSRLLKFIGTLSATVRTAKELHSAKLKRIRETNAKLSAEVARLTLAQRAKKEN